MRVDQGIRTINAVRSTSTYVRIISEQVVKKKTHTHTHMLSITTSLVNVDCNRCHHVLQPFSPTLLPAAHLLYHHCCCCCNCCTDAATFACPVYTCSFAAAVASRPNVSLYWNHLPPYPVFGSFPSDPPSSRLSKHSCTSLVNVAASTARMFTARGPTRCQPS